MVTEIGSSTEDLVRAVLDASMLRYKVISNNIANNGVSGFVPSKVKFESILRSELDSNTALNDSEKLGAVLNSVTPEIVARESNVVDGKTTDSLALEMSNLAKNTLRYEAIIKSMGNLGSIREMAITGGR